MLHKKKKSDTREKDAQEWGLDIGGENIEINGNFVIS